MPSLPVGVDEQAIAVADILKLGLFALFGRQAPGCTLPPPGFLRLNAPHAVERWLFVYAPELGDEPWLRALFDLCLPVDAPGSRLALHPDLRDFQAVPTKKAALEDEPCTLADLVLDARLAPSLGFPAAGFALDKLVGKGRGFGLDCEMCLAGERSVLTRIAVVDFDENVVYDALVKPAEPITEYLTPFSGITADMLKDVTLTLDGVRRHLQTLIGQTDYIIGHSLDSDFRALGLTHTRIVDTSVLFPHPYGLPNRLSLKSLAKQYLKQDIQASAHGHAPAEDALACVRLVKEKLAHGLRFGVPLFERGAPLTQFLASAGFRSAIVDALPPLWDVYGAGSHVLADSAASVAARAEKLLRTHAFVFAALRGAPADARPALVGLLRALPPRTLVTLYTGADAAGAADVQRLVAQRRQFRTEFATKHRDDIAEPWTDAHNDQLAAAVGRARRGAALFSVTIAPDDFESLPADLQSANKRGLRDGAGVGGDAEASSERKRVKRAHDAGSGSDSEHAAADAGERPESSGASAAKADISDGGGASASGKSGHPAHEKDAAERKATHAGDAAGGATGTDAEAAGTTTSADADASSSLATDALSAKEEDRSKTLPDGPSAPPSESELSGSVLESESSSSPSSPSGSADDSVTGHPRKAALLAADTSQVAAESEPASKASSEEVPSKGPVSEGPSAAPEPEPVTAVPADAGGSSEHKELAARGSQDTASPQ